MKQIKKNLFFVVLVIVSVFAVFTSCNKPQQKPETIQNIPCFVDVKYVEIAPGGVSAKITSYVFTGKVLDCKNDTAIIEAPSTNNQVKIMVSVPMKKRLVVGSLVEVGAEIWSGAYESGWAYSIKRVLDNNEMIVEYVKNDKQTIELVYDSIAGYLTMRMYYEWGSTGDSELEVMKKEVSKIFSSNQMIITDSGEYALKYLGGYPLWLPFHTHGPGNSYVSLPFSRNVVLEGKTFVIKGTKGKQEYYPYADFVGKNL
jgi:hypothetical protein